MGIEEIIGLGMLHLGKGGGALLKGQLVQKKKKKVHLSINTSQINNSDQLDTKQH